MFQFLLSVALGRTWARLEEDRSRAAASRESAEEGPGSGYCPAIRLHSMRTRKREVEESGEMEERARRIVETAVALAEEGGFEAVRLRDVASHAGVALGTLYRRFRSKEDLLVAALDLETQAMARRLEQRPVQGASELERVVAFFRLTTRGLVRRPNLARAMVKAAASGDPELAKQVASFHERVEKMIVAAMRGPNVRSTRAEDAGQAEVIESRLAYHLNMYWFALMVGWSGGLHTQHDVIDGMKEVTGLLLRGAGRKASGEPER